MTYPAAILAAENPLLLYFKGLFTADPFRGIYQVNAFDLLLLIPYFLVLTILSVYGLHRYYLVYSYYRHRRNLPQREPGQISPLPCVTDYIGKPHAGATTRAGGRRTNHDGFFVRRWRRNGERQATRDSLARRGRMPRGTRRSCSPRLLCGAIPSGSRRRMPR